MNPLSRDNESGVIAHPSLSPLLETEPRQISSSFGSSTQNGLLPFDRHKPNSGPYDQSRNSKLFKVEQSSSSICEAVSPAVVGNSIAEARLLRSPMSTPRTGLPTVHGYTTSQLGPGPDDHEYVYGLRKYDEAAKKRSHSSDEMRPRYIPDICISEIWASSSVFPPGTGVGQNPDLPSLFASQNEQMRPPSISQTAQDDFSRLNPRTSEQTDDVSQAQSEYAGGISFHRHPKEPPLAYLNLDLEISSATRSFSDTLAVTSVVGERLLEIVSKIDQDKVYWLKQLFQKKRQELEPDDLPTICDKSEEGVINSITLSLDSSAQVRFERDEVLTFKGSNDRLTSHKVRLGLTKKESTYYVILALVAPAMLPLLPQAQPQLPPVGSSSTVTSALTPHYVQPPTGRSEYDETQHTSQAPRSKFHQSHQSDLRILLESSAYAKTGADLVENKLTKIDTESSEDSSFTDEEGAWSRDDFAEQRPILYSYQRLRVEAAMEIFWDLMNQHWRILIQKKTSGTGNDISTASGSAVLRGGVTTAPENSSWKNTGRLKERSNERDGDDRHPKRRKEEISVPDDISEKPQYACPYRKHNRLKYNVHTNRTCALSCFPTIARVKEHLYRTHRAPTQCPRCSLQLEDRSALTTHLKAKTICEDIDSEPVEGFDLDVEEKLKRRKKTSRDQTDFERWQYIYRILFEDDKGLPSPYFEPPKDEPPPPSIPIEEYIRQEVPRRVRQHIEVQIAANDEGAFYLPVASAIMSTLEREIDACIVAHGKMVAETNQMSGFRTPSSSSLRQNSIQVHQQEALSTWMQPISEASPSDTSNTNFDFNGFLESADHSDRLLPTPTPIPLDVTRNTQLQLDQHLQLASFDYELNSASLSPPSTTTFFSQPRPIDSNELDGNFRQLGHQ